MYASELRTCGLGAVVAMLFGAGIGFGWYYFADNGGGRAAVASAPTTPANQDAPNPVLSSSAAQPEGPVLEVSRSPDLLHARGIALDLSDDQKLALIALLTRAIQSDRYPSSPRVRTLKNILVKLDTRPLEQPYPAPNAYAPPEGTRTRARHQG